MPINVMPPTSEKKFFGKDVDPEQGTYVVIGQARHESEMRRGLMIFGNQDNRIDWLALQYWEIWSTYHDTNLEYNGKKLPLKSDTGEVDFYNILANLPSFIVSAWERLVWEVNPDWSPASLIGGDDSKNSGGQEDIETISEEG